MLLQESTTEKGGIGFFRGMPGNPYDVTGPMSTIHSSVFGTSDDFMKDNTVNGSIHDYQKDAPKKIRQKLKDFGVVSVISKSSNFGKS